MRLNNTGETARQIIRRGHLSQVPVIPSLAESLMWKSSPEKIKHDSVGNEFSKKGGRRTPCQLTPLNQKIADNIMFVVKKMSQYS